MANIYLGDLNKIDTDVLEKVQTLSDDYWIFAEFNVEGRNIDWFITRAVTPQFGVEQHSTLIITELKRLSRPIEGAVDSRWRWRVEGGVGEEIIPSNGGDMNYYWQSVNTANA